MDIHECIAILVAQGAVVEPDDRPGHEGSWLVFYPDCPEEIENGGCPDFFTTPSIIQWVERYHSPKKQPPTDALIDYHDGESLDLAQEHAEVGSTHEEGSATGRSD